METKHIHIIGGLKNKVICKQCYICNETYYMTCDDHLFKPFGYTLPGNSLNDWVCPTCGEEIIKIKNL